MSRCHPIERPRRKPMVEILLILMAFFNALGLLLIKGSASGERSLLKKLYQKKFIAGIFCLALSPLFLALTAKHCSLSKLNAFSAVSYVFLIIMSGLFLKEKIDKQKIVGSILIIIGLLLLK